MKAFILSVSLTAIPTTSAVATAMQYLDHIQDVFDARTIKRTDDGKMQGFTLTALIGR